ncbi:MAG: hypothetical protein KR126chlam5_01200 [Candidatus Anoxychlamydiales bacterium]|nr:hypothetical protein [Candidatus Anoxychlamydiales bacterium]
MADSGSGGFNFDPSNAQDALNLAAAYNTIVTSKTNRLIDLLRMQQAKTLDQLVAASYAAANSMMYQALFDAVSNLVIAGGGMMTMNDVSNAHGLVKNGLEQEQKLQKTQKGDEEKIKGMKPGAENDTLQKTIDDNEKKLKNLKTSNEKKQKLADTQMQMATQKSTILQAAAPGLAALPKAAQENIKIKAEAVQTIMSQINGMLSSSYDKSNQTLASFFNINFFAALVALGSLQLR